MEHSYHSTLSDLTYNPLSRGRVENANLNVYDNAFVLRYFPR